MDLNYLLFLQNMRESMGGILDGFMLFITRLGEARATFFLLAFVYWCVDSKAGRFMGMNISLSCTLSQMLKNVFCVDRPWIRSEKIHPVEAAIPAAGGYSFPSGHTTRATATWGAFGYYECDKSKNKKAKGIYKGITYFMFALILIIGFSRNYLGVHTPQDVAVAFLYSSAMWIVSKKIIRWMNSAEYGDILMLIAICIIGAAWIVFAGNLANIGSAVAFMISEVIDRRIIHFKEPQSIVARLLLLVIAGGILLIVLSYAPNMLSSRFGKISGSVASFLYMFYIMTIVPAIYKVLTAL